MHTETGLSRDDEKKARQLRWWLRSLDEMRLFPHQRAQLISMHFIDGRLSRRLWGIRLLGIVVGLAVGMSAAVAIDWIATTPPHRGFVSMAALILTAIVAYIVSRPMQMRHARLLLREELLNRWDVPVCQGCGYALKGLGPAAAECPECGTPISQRVRTLLGT